MKNELKTFLKVLHPDYPDCFESQSEDEEQRRSSSQEALLKITLDFLERMQHEELADCLWKSKRISAELSWWRQDREETSVRFSNGVGSRSTGLG